MLAAIRSRTFCLLVNLSLRVDPQFHAYNCYVIAQLHTEFVDRFTFVIDFLQKLFNQISCIVRVYIATHHSAECNLPRSPCFCNTTYKVTALTRVA
jgi:hypothetical protein